MHPKLRYLASFCLFLLPDVSADGRMSIEKCEWIAPILSLGAADAPHASSYVQTHVPLVDCCGFADWSPSAAPLPSLCLILALHEICQCFVPEKTPGTKRLP